MTMIKDPSTRARRNKDTVIPTKIDFIPGQQPTLPRGMQWHRQTKIWWRTWCESPLAEHLMAVDWQVLLNAALMHNELWTNGDLRLVPSIINVEKDFGATFTARLRLRIQAQEAEAAEIKGDRRRATVGMTQPKTGVDPRNVLSIVG
jgi:hypothetical protein